MFQNFGIATSFHIHFIARDIHLGGWSLKYFHIYLLPQLHFSLCISSAFASLDFYCKHSTYVSLFQTNHDYFIIIYFHFGCDLWIYGLTNGRYDKPLPLLFCLSFWGGVIFLTVDYAVHSFVHVMLHFPSVLFYKILLKFFFLVAKFGVKTAFFSVSKKKNPSFYFITIMISDWLAVHLPSPVFCILTAQTDGFSILMHINYSWLIILWFYCYVFFL